MLNIVRRHLPEGSEMSDYNTDLREQLIINIICGDYRKELTELLLTNGLGEETARESTASRETLGSPPPDVSSSARRRSRRSLIFSTSSFGNPALYLNSERGSG